MSPILIHDTVTAQNGAVDEHASMNVLESSPLQRSDRVGQPLAAAMLTVLDEIAIAAQAGKRSRDQCGGVQVVPITAINDIVLSGRDQIRYMRLLGSIARDVGVPPFGSVSVLLSNAHTAATALNIDMPRSFGGHGQIAHVWMPDLSQLTDMAVQINLRAGAPAVNRATSPIRSVAQQGRARGGRPSTDSGLKGSALPALTDPPHCVSAGCPCTATFNGEPGEHCCFTCRRGQPCAENYRVLRITKPVGGGVPHCATEGCPCTSTFNGQPGEACCRTCQRGTPCAENYHPQSSRMIPGQPHGQWPQQQQHVLPQSRLTCTRYQAWMLNAPCPLSLVYLARQMMMKATYMNYVGPKYHRRMVNRNQ